MVRLLPGAPHQCGECKSNGLKPIFGSNPNSTTYGCYYLKVGAIALLSAISLSPPNSVSKSACTAAESPGSASGMLVRALPGCRSSRKLGRCPDLRCLLSLAEAGNRAGIQPAMAPPARSAPANSARPTAGPQATAQSTRNLSSAPPICPRLSPLPVPRLAPPSFRTQPHRMTKHWRPASNCLYGNLHRQRRHPLSTPSHPLEPSPPDPRPLTMSRVVPRHCVHARRCTVIKWVGFGRRRRSRWTTRSSPRKNGRERKLRRIWSQSRTWMCCSTTGYVYHVYIVSYLFEADLPVRQDGEEGEHHALQGSVDMPAYPYVNFAPLLSRFGRDITAFQHHVFPQLVWTSVGRLDHIFNVEKVRTVILRRKGVTDMPGLEEEVGRVQKPLAAPHYRSNFVAEKKAMRTELSRRKSLQIPTSKKERHLTAASSSPSLTAAPASASPQSDSSSDVEILEPTASASTSSFGSSHKHQDRPEPPIERYNKHARKCTAQRFAAQASSPTPSSPISVSEISWRQPSNSLPPVVTHLTLPVGSSPEQSPIMVSPPLTCTSTTSPSSSQLPAVSVHVAKKRLSKVYWYTGLHCIEVAAGIAKMASPEAAGLSKAERFAFAFGTDRKYSERTFQDAQKQWSLASPKEREDFIQLGLSPAGLWKAFSKDHPLKNRKNMRTAAVDSDDVVFG